MKGSTPHPEIPLQDVPAAASAPAVATDSFVINLCSSTTPMALAQPKLAELKRYTFFVSRRLEDGRERFRLHMGYFDSLLQAEELLSVVRDIYPGAWAGEAPGKRLRARAAAVAAAQPVSPAPAVPPALAPPPPMPAAAAPVPVLATVPIAEPTLTLALAAEPAATVPTLTSAPTLTSTPAPTSTPTPTSAPPLKLAADPPDRGTAGALGRGGGTSGQKGQRSRRTTRLRSALRATLQCS